MKRKYAWMGLAGVFASLLAASAFAGYKNGYTVSVNNTTRIAYGTSGAARSAPDINQFIGCTLMQSGTAGESLSGYCEAETSTAGFGYCYIPAAAAAGFAKVMATIGNNPYYYFTWDTNGNCTSLSIDSYSFWAPITP
jgi:hypothetical protein